jgi:hypothetical protein
MRIVFSQTASLVVLFVSYFFTCIGCPVADRKEIILRIEVLDLDMLDDKMREVIDQLIVRTTIPFHALISPIRARRTLDHYNSYC